MIPRILQTSHDHKICWLAKIGWSENFIYDILILFYVYLNKMTQ